MTAACTEAAPVAAWKTRPSWMMLAGADPAQEVRTAAVEYVAQQVRVSAEVWADYDWQSEAVQRRRGGIRVAYGFGVNAE
ncbi:hypothetical protein [Streptomyces nogalater]|uniref:Uncharacterized protein n=1 Tax=Streptomyces nogalater TaxID=38314 RepID=A0ABW0WT08_STRNO